MKKLNSVFFLVTVLFASSTFAATPAKTAPSVKDVCGAPVADAASSKCNITCGSHVCTYETTSLEGQCNDTNIGSEGKTVECQSAKAGVFPCKIKDVGVKLTCK